MLILISAGEASGEMYGAQLIEALQRAATHIKIPTLSRQHRETRVGQPHSEPSFFGVGGERMRAAGCDTIIDAKDLAVVGITEILSRLPKILKLYKNLIREADRRKPDLAIVIDSPAFNWRVARQMKKRGIPTVYYVAPQFWAWRQGRVRLIRKYIEKALVIFPFEERFYRERGVDATFVGHPLAELPAPTITRDEYARQFHLDPNKLWITLMPGSRVKEVRMNLPTILEAARTFGDRYEFLLPVAPTLDREFLAGILQDGALDPQKRKRTSAAIADRLDSFTVPRSHRVEDPTSGKTGEKWSTPHSFVFEGVTLVPEALPALYHSRVGIIASGTATVEAAMMNLPFVMVYRVSPLTYLLGKPRVKVPRFAMVNLIAGKEIVPELVQNNFTPANVAARISEILPDGPARDRMLEGLASVREGLRGSDAGGLHLPPAERAAKIILSLAKKLSRGSEKQKRAK